MAKKMAARVRIDNRVIYLNLIEINLWLEELYSTVMQSTRRARNFKHMVKAIKGSFENEEL